MGVLQVLFFGLLAVSFKVSGIEGNIYDEYCLYQLRGWKLEHFEALRNFEDPDGQIEVFKRSRDLNDTLDVLVPPNKTHFLEDFADEHGVDYEIREKNYGRSLDLAERSPRRRVQRGFNPLAYNSWSTIQDYLDELEKTHPQLIKLQPLGKSYQGRLMKLVKVSTDPSKKNPIIFIDAGIHAREWVAPATALYLIHKFTTEPDALADLDGVDFYILPVVNPDGYEYTRSSSSNRLWRKTRSKTNQKCFGVDGNRNYGYRWGVSGVSNNPCDQETYAGPKPFSEPETQMVRNVMMENSKRIKLYVSLHSYGQYLVYPWGYTGDYLPKDWRKLDNMARIVSDAVKRAGGRPFKVMSAGKWYAAAGGSDDYAFGAVGIPYSYTMELTDGFDFRYPERHLKSVLPQFYEGFRAFGRQIKAEFGHGAVTKSQLSPNDESNSDEYD